MADETPPQQGTPNPPPSESVKSEPLPTKSDPRLVDRKEYSEQGGRTHLTGDGAPRDGGKDG